MFDAQDRAVIPFLVLTLPRSRSFWLSKFLDCPHEPSRHFRSGEALCAYFNDGACGVDTALGSIWHGYDPLVRRDLRVVVVHRPVADVLASLDRLGIRHPNLEAGLHRQANRMTEIRGAHFTYSQIATYEGAARLFHACRGEACDVDRWNEMKDDRREADLRAILRDAVANPGFRDLYGLAA